jgi:hypothetical protein
MTYRRPAVILAIATATVVGVWAALGTPITKVPICGAAMINPSDALSQSEAGVMLFPSNCLPEPVWRQLARLTLIGPAGATSFELRREYVRAV